MTDADVFLEAGNMHGMRLWHCFGTGTSVDCTTQVIENSFLVLKSRVGAKPPPNQIISTRQDKRHSLTSS